MRSHAIEAAASARKEAGVSPSPIWTKMSMVFAAIGEGLALQRRYSTLTARGVSSDRALHQALKDIDDRARQR